MVKSSTIKDVAEKAKVSISTVSRYLNDTAKINPLLRMRVEQAIRELDFVPNAAARSLKNQQTRVIGILVSDIANAFFINICKTLEGMLAQYGYSLMICSSYENRDYEARSLKVLFERRVDAIVVCPGGKNNDLLLSMHRSGMPVVVLDRIFDDLPLDTVAENTREASKKLTQSLLGMGHRKIACLMGSEQSKTAIQREEGIREAYAEAGLEMDERLIYRNCTDEWKAHLATQSLLEDAAAPTALFATNPRITNGALLYLVEKQIALPEQLSFACFTQKNTMYPYPAQLTCIQQDPESIGLKTGELLINRLEEGKKPKSPAKYLFEQVLIPGQTVKSIL